MSSITTMMDERRLDDAKDSLSHYSRQLIYTMQELEGDVYCSRAGLLEERKDRYARYIANAKARIEELERKLKAQ